jgi:hypothetical protein
MACSSQRAVFVLPPEYTGWVEVTVANPSCPNAAKDSRGSVVRVSADGRGCTSSDLRATIADFSFYIGDARTPLRLTESGGGGKIWGLAGIGTKQCFQDCGPLGDGGPTGATLVLEFFVGSEQQYRSGAYPHPR